MRINGRIAAGMLIAFGAVLGILLGISLILASDGNGAAEFEVTVRFNTSVTQDDIDEAGILLRTFADDLVFVNMDIFPPVGRAVVATDTPGFCQAVAAELEAKSYVNDVTCRSWAGGDGGEPDVPVSTFAP